MVRKEFSVTIKEELEILPCPFCGSESLSAEVWYDKDRPTIHGKSYVKCKDCLATGPLDYDSHHLGDGVKLWNKRATKSKNTEFVGGI